MGKLKHSRQREAIKEYLSHTNDHPTADMIYLHIKSEFPHISLGTVYRNLNLLTERGELKKLPSLDGGDRFDADTSEHYHFFCSSCQCVLDLKLQELEQINQIAGADFDGIIHSHQIIFYGICPHCLHK